MLAIRNYGILWERRRVFFGWKGKAGSLLGYNNVFDKVDFRKQMGVYILYNSHQEIVYIGRTGNPGLFSRLRDHLKDHLWNRWEYFSWFGICEINKTNAQLRTPEDITKRLTGTIDNAVDEIEAILLTIVEPRLNKQGPKWSSDGKKTQEFYQYLHDDLEINTVETLAEQQKKIIEMLTTNKLTK
jgi:hypothetical protein